MNTKIARIKDFLIETWQSIDLEFKAKAWYSFLLFCFVVGLFVFGGEQWEQMTKQREQKDYEKYRIENRKQICKQISQGNELLFECVYQYPSRAEFDEFNISKAKQ